jgi:uracil-DNA glycosylase
VREVESVVDGLSVEEELPVVPLPEARQLNENEERRLRRKEDALLRELRIFLR